MDRRERRINPEARQNELDPIRASMAYAGGASQESTNVGAASPSNPAYFDGGGATPRPELRVSPFCDSSSRSESPTVGVGIPIDLNQAFANSPNLQRGRCLNRGDVSGRQCLFHVGVNGEDDNDAHMFYGMTNGFNHVMVRDHRRFSHDHCVQYICDRPVRCLLQ